MGTEVGMPRFPELVPAVRADDDVERLVERA
jgi:hypothetical protein